MDLFAWQNLQDVLASFRVKPTKQTSIQVDYNAFWLANTNDAWYAPTALPGSVPSRRAPPIMSAQRLTSPPPISRKSS